MKNLSTLLRNSNLTPKEKVLLRVQDEVQKSQTGKGTLTDADLHAISNGWTPKDNDEVREYNIYNDGWNTENSMRIDMQTIALEAQNQLLRASRIVDQGLWRGKLHPPEILSRGDPSITEEEVLTLLLENTGLDYDQTVHALTFYNIPKETQDDLLILYPDAHTERQYLDEQEELAHFFTNGNTLTKTEKEELVKIIISSIPWEYVDLLKKKELDMYHLLFNGYFADLPIIDIFKKWAEYNNVEYANGNNLKEILTSHGDLEGIMRTTLLTWLNRGLFVSEYAPLCVSNSKATYSGIDTKLTHKDLIAFWIKEKEKSKTLIDSLIAKGNLKTKTTTKEFFGIEKHQKVLTGTSLYALSNECTFAKEYKEQIAGLREFGYLLLFLKRRDFITGYTTLLTLSNIYKKLSNIYELDLSYFPTRHLKNLDEDIRLMNQELTMVYEHIEAGFYSKKEYAFHIETSLETMFIDTGKLEAVSDETTRAYGENFEKIFKAGIWGK
jgi:hypothetical protein